MYVAVGALIVASLFGPSPSAGPVRLPGLGQPSVQTAEIRPEPVRSMAVRADRRASSLEAGESAFALPDTCPSPENALARGHARSNRKPLPAYRTHVRSAASDDWAPERGGSLPGHPPRSMHPECPRPMRC